ncbi:MAG: hypothetical protein K0Q95_1100 [Bacteroidota bacterium]|jgi:hypothetical protein|nr:hypothetical protein [Bacteroidota bacterium]
MINHQHAKLHQVAVHKVGNKGLNEEIVFSKNTIPLEDDNTNQLLLKYFLGSFSGEEAFEFFHESDLELNESYSFASKIFNNKNSLFAQSKSFAKHLHLCSEHPKIKNGELYVAYFTGVMLDDEHKDVVGIFKSESKEDFLKVEQNGEYFEINADEGISTKKLDKGCLIFKTEEAEGYKVFIIDNLSKFGEAQYWKTDFLKVKPCSDKYHHTKDFLSITKNYVTKQLTEDFEVNKSEQAAILNRSMEYFKSHDNFDKKEFEEEVFQDPGVIKSFRKYDDEYRENHNIELEDEFEISPEAVKKQARIFKSIIKLDKNFHIYVHGAQDMIEQGVDKDGRKFYKIYFEKEM